MYAVLEFLWICPAFIEIFLLLCFRSFAGSEIVMIFYFEDPVNLQNIPFHQSSYKTTTRGVNINQLRILVSVCVSKSIPTKHCSWGFDPMKDGSFKPLLLPITSNQNFTIFVNWKHCNAENGETVQYRWWIDDGVEVYNEFRVSKLP